MNAALWVRVGPEKDGKRGSGAAGRDGLGAGVGERWRGRWTEGRVYVRASIERVWRTTVRSAFDILGLVYVSVGSMEKDEKVSMVIAGSSKQQAASREVTSAAANTSTGNAKPAN